MTGAHYVDGEPRSNRDTKTIAIEAAEYLRYEHPHAEVTVHNLVTDDTGRARQVQTLSWL